MTFIHIFKYNLEGKNILNALKLLKRPPGEGRLKKCYAYTKQSYKETIWYKFKVLS